MRFHILTLFPEVVRTYFDESILKIGQQKGLLEFHLVNFRDFTTDRHRTVDDAPFGGGPGMLLKPEPIFAAIESVESEWGETRKILLTPQGETFTQAKAEQLSESERDLLFLCGRYEGFDERVRLGFPWEEISIGDYVLSGGELPALVVIEAISRLLPGVLGDPESARRDSFAEGLLEYPQYTRPREYRGWSVPEVLLSGHHAEIEAWRRKESERRTSERFTRENARRGDRDGGLEAQSDRDRRI
ncbi:MAG: tRNA (guanosine(37)-N1)-methyltransferase TrmD [Planctomycetota bacterium]